MIVRVDLNPEIVILSEGLVLTLDIYIYIYICIFSEGVRLLSAKHLQQGLI